MKQSISIIMPVYNAGHTLPECMDSILKQTFSDFELLIIDDGSTDNSIEVITGFKDQRIRLIRNEHNFIGSLNMGLNHANGKYIARMDADDIMLPQRLQTQFDFMELHPDIDVCGSYATSFGEKEAVIRRPLYHKDIISSMLRANPFMHPTVMIRRFKLQQSGCLYQSGYPCAEDYKLWTDLAVKGFQFANIPEPLIRYRISPQQVTQVLQNDMRITSIKIGLEYAEVVMEQMAEKEKMYFDLFGSLTEMVNNELMEPNTFLQVIQPVYTDFLNRHNPT